MELSNIVALLYISKPKVKELRYPMAILQLVTIPQFPVLPPEPEGATVLGRVKNLFFRRKNKWSHKDPLPEENKEILVDTTKGYISNDHITESFYNVNIILPYQKDY